MARNGSSAGETNTEMSRSLSDRAELLERFVAVRAATERLADAWEWTSSAYEPYPGYHTPAGAVGEYNGEFMVNQLVLRGGSALTPRGHVRASYRNFWHPDTRFQMTGVRLARSEAR